jgi:hypothetical protein
LNICNPKKINEIITLIYVLNVHECSSSLISITQLAENNIDTHFAKNHASIYRAGIEIFCAEIRMRLYYICNILEPSIEQVKVSMTLDQQKQSSVETKIEVYGDEDFAGDSDKLKSTSGFIAIDRHEAAVAWKSAKQL